MRSRLLLGLAAVCCAGCSLLDAERTLVMPLDALDAPSTATRGQSFDVRVVGLLTNGCQQLDRLDVEPDAPGLLLTMIATERQGTGCTDDIRYAEQTYRAFPREAGPLIIRARNGEDGELLERTVLVE